MSCTDKKWISVNDKLPKKDGRYLTRTINLTGNRPIEDNIFIADFFGNDWLFDGWEDNEVTHWMPLPKPPKQGR